MRETLRRSILYVPGSAEAMIRKASTRGADVLVLDLEDGVHPDLKDEARQRVARLYRELNFGGAEVLIRANHPTTSWGARDLDMLAGLRPAGAVFPKMQDPAEVAIGVVVDQPHGELRDPQPAPSGLGPQLQRHTVAWDGEVQPREGAHAVGLEAAEGIGDAQAEDLVEQVGDLLIDGPPLQRRRAVAAQIAQVP